MCSAVINESPVDQDPNLQGESLAVKQPNLWALEQQNFGLLDQSFDQLTAPKSATIEEHVYRGEKPSSNVACLEVNGVSLFILTRSHFQREKIRTIVSAVKRKADLNQHAPPKLMIADTVPSNAVLDLVRKSEESGIETHYRDHHRADCAGKRHSHLQANYTLMEEILGPRFVCVNRTTAPSVSTLIPQQYLVRNSFAGYLAAPADTDGFITGMMGAGLLPDHLNDDNEYSSTDEVLGRIDSPDTEFAQERRGTPINAWLQEYFRASSGQPRNGRGILRVHAALARAIKAGQVTREWDGLVMDGYRLLSVAEKVIRGAGKIYRTPGWSIRVLEIDPGKFSRRQWENWIDRVYPRHDPESAKDNQVARRLLLRKDLKLDENLIRSCLRTMGDSFPKSMLICLHQKKKRQTLVFSIGKWRRLFNFKELLDDCSKKRIPLKGVMTGGRARLSSKDWRKFRKVLMDKLDRIESQAEKKTIRRITRNYLYD